MKKLSLLLAVIMIFGAFTVCAAAMDTSNFECVDDVVYIKDFKYTITAGEIIAKSGDEALVVEDEEGKLIAADKIVPNGAYLVKMIDGAVEDKVQICIMQDVNCDGKVTAADARLALRCGAQLETLNVIQTYAGDVTGDGRVTAADARLILRKPAGLI